MATESFFKKFTVSGEAAKRLRYDLDNAKPMKAPKVQMWYPTKKELDDIAASRTESLKARVKSGDLGSWHLPSQDRPI